MTKKPFITTLRVVPLLILLCLLLTGCGCKHQWNPATCETPKTCSACEATEGEALGHSWADASCETPKTCTVCGTTEGEALGHTWEDATCTNPKTCSRCQATEGEALSHTWEDATCTNPKTCSVCNATEGEALGHTWVNATCETPKTCSVCNATEGEALGHTWVKATCETPKTCSVCKKTEGNALGHNWQEATTEVPKTCSVCKKTDGSRIITDSRFKTAACKQLFGTWKGVVELPGSDLVEEDFTGTLKLDYCITFNRDGSFKESTTLINEAEFVKDLENYNINGLYAEFAAMGYNQAQADEAMINTYGMDVKTYAKKMATAYNWKELLSSEFTGVYYVANGLLYSGIKWNSALESENYSISGNSLTIETLAQEYPGLIFTKS